MAARCAVLMKAPAPEPGQKPLTVADRLVVVDLDDGEVWFSVDGATLIDAAADHKGRWLFELISRKIPGLDPGELVGMAPASWLRATMAPIDLERLDCLAATATAAALQTSGASIQ